MAKRTDIKKILIIGSGPIVIGQAAEFDYAGTQACLALKEEGYEVVLVNSNPATIMTDQVMADKIYLGKNAKSFKSSPRFSNYDMVILNIDENKQVKYLKAGAIKAIKARNIQILEGGDGLTAVAEVILETEDATDAGRILEGFEDGQKSLMQVQFTYYTDKGWVLTSSNK